MRKIAEAHGLSNVLDKPLKKEGSNLLALPLRHMGIELEAETCRLYKPHKLWGTRSEGSLRNDGLEIASHPWYGKNLVEAIESASTTLGDGHVFNHRCSTHIHLDMQRRPEIEVYRILFLYSILEDVFQTYFCEDNRRHNNHCVPFRYYTRAVQALSTGLPTYNTRYLAQNWSKYVAINVLPLRNYGTIEFRAASGTSDPRVLLSLVNFIQGIAKYATKDLDLQDLVDSVCAEGEEMVNEIGEKAGIVYHPNMMDDMLEGARHVQLALTAEPQPEVSGRATPRVAVASNPRDTFSLDDLIRMQQYQATRQELQERTNVTPPPAQPTRRRR